jgi:hypothetical protein
MDIRDLSKKARTCFYAICSIANVVISKNKGKTPEIIKLDTSALNEMVSFLGKVEVLRLLTAAESLVDALRARLEKIKEQQPKPKEAESVRF